MLRNLSPTPASPDWSNAVKPADALALMQPAHPLSSAACESFLELTTSSLSDICRWIILNGENLTMLCFSKPPTASEGIRQLVLEGFEARCKSLRRLHIAYVSDRQFSAQIL